MTENLSANFVKEIGFISQELDKIGLVPVLIGGIALILLGSRRVTQDVDFVVSDPEAHLDKIMEIFYGRGFELASKLNQDGDIVRTIDNPRVAATRCRIDAPESIYFWNPKTRLRIDLLFDFPKPAKELAARAKKIKILSYPFRVACTKDLLEMKKMAFADRALSTDAQDIEFLQQIIKRK